METGESMKSIEVSKLDLFMSSFYPIGFGSSARLYLTHNLDVLKIFKNNFEGQWIKSNPDYIDKFCKISELANGSFIGPEQLIYSGGKFVGYTYHFVNAPTLSKLDKGITLSGLFANYDKLAINTRLISNEHFLLSDMHSKNILFDGNFYIIDLDHCDFVTKYDSESIYRLNMDKLFRAIIKQIYGIRSVDSVVFDDKELNELYRSINKGNIEEVRLFLSKVKKMSMIENPTVRDVKKYVKAQGVDYGYNGSNEK